MVPQVPKGKIRGAAPSCRTVFNGICLIYGVYRDPSLALRMTVSGRKDSM